VEYEFVGKSGLEALWGGDRAVNPEDVVPAEDLDGVIEELVVAAARDLERELFDAVGGICGGVAKNVEDLFLV
jgi:hypothetical protein